MNSPEFRLQDAQSLTAEELAALRRLHAEAFGTNTPGNPAAREMEWCLPDWHLIYGDRAEPLCHIGIVIRTGKLVRAEVRIGGIGDVGTSPSHRREGLASTGLALAQQFLKERALHFGLLVCRDEMVPFHKRLGWRPYSEPVFVTRFGERIQFTLSPVMVLETSGPVSGAIDLCGPPW